MTGQPCPNCGSLASVQHHTGRLAWLGGALYLGVIVLAVIWGILWASLISEPLTSWTDVPVGFRILNVALLVAIVGGGAWFARLYFMRTCPDCGHTWLALPMAAHKPNH